MAGPVLITKSPTPTMDATVAPASRKRSRKSFWMKQLHTWHWMSSAISLIGMLLFAITGFTLNHASKIEASPTSVETRAQLPQQLLPLVAPDDGPDARKPIPSEIGAFLKEQLKLQPRAMDAEWSADEIYLGMPRPGGDAWIAIDRTTGEVTSEISSRGWIAYLNDLHKGRNSGTAWSWFIDIFVLASVIFSLTGLVLLQLHSKNRRSTWPLVGMGFVIPAFIALFLIH